MFDYDEGECDPRTTIHMDGTVRSHIRRLAREKKFVHDGAHTLVYEEEYNHHNEDEYLGTTYTTIIISRHDGGYFVTYKKSYETDYDCSYDYFINEEKVEDPEFKKVLKSAFIKREDHFLY